MKNIKYLVASIIVMIGLITNGPTTFAQGIVKWAFNAKKISGKNYEIHMTAMVDQRWHIYSQDTPLGGPTPTLISFNKSPLIIIKGQTEEEGKQETYMSEVFHVNVYAYTGKVDFIQNVQLRKEVKTVLTGKVKFMACTDSECLPVQEIPFTIKLE